MYSPVYNNTWRSVNFLNSIHIMKNKAVKGEERTKKTRNIKKKKKESKTADINPTTSIVTSNVKDQTIPSKGKDWIKKCDSTKQCLQETHFRFRHKGK